MFKFKWTLSYTAHLVLLNWPKILFYCCWWEICRMWGPFWSATGCSSLSDTLQYIHFWFAYLDWLALFADDSALFSTHAKADVIIVRLQSALTYSQRTLFYMEGYIKTFRLYSLPIEEPGSFLHSIYLWMATLFFLVTMKSTWACFWIRN
jgi:hypothetical protein